MSNRIKPINESTEKNDQTIDELINALPLDMKEEILKQLLVVQTSPKLSPKKQAKMGSVIDRFSAIFSTKTEKPKTVRLSQVNKEFRDAQSYKIRLEKLDSKYPVNSIDDLDNFKKHTTAIVKILGDIPVKNLYNEKNHFKKPKQLQIISDILYSVTDPLYETSYDLSENVDAKLSNFKTLTEAKDDYIRKHPGKDDFEKKQKEWIELWDFDHNFCDHIDDIKTSIKTYKNEMIAYDKENEKETIKKMNEFLKLNEKKITFKEYNKAVTSLPISVKAMNQRHY